MTWTIKVPTGYRGPDSVCPAAPPSGDEGWASLLAMDYIALRELGLEPFTDPLERPTVLMLLPGEWFMSIPEGLQVESVFGHVFRFQREIIGPMTLCAGSLAFGLRVTYP